MKVLAFATLLVTGFTACAEFGSYAFTHPVVRRLPPEQHLQVEQGLLRTIGRVMPLLMPAAVVLSCGFAFSSRSRPGRAKDVLFAAAASFVAVLSITLTVNVPINTATARWNPADPPPDWKTVRHRWELFQGIRSWLLLLGFALTCLGVAAA